MKALIPAAGFGTRFLPATKAVPKEMLPIGAKPALQLIVEEALAAGADEVVIVTSPEKTALQKHFAPDAALRARCAAKPAIDAALAHLEEISRHVSWAFQTEQKGLGHAVLQAAPFFAHETEPVLVLLGDALVSGEPPSAAMAALSRAHGGASVVGLEEVPLERISRYGVADVAEDLGGGAFLLKGLVEKPAPEKAPSRLAVAGRYLLDPAIFALLATQTPGAGGEIQLTDALARLLAVKPVYGFRYPGKRHDLGNPAGYFQALAAFHAAETEA